MPILRLRISGAPAQSERIAERLSVLEGVRRVDRIDERLTYRSGDDSSSAGLAENVKNQSDGLEIEVDDQQTADLARLLAEREARAAGAAMEVVSEF